MEKSSVAGAWMKLYRVVDNMTRLGEGEGEVAKN